MGYDFFSSLAWIAFECLKYKKKVIKELYSRNSTVKERYISVNHIT